MSMRWGLRKLSSTSHGCCARLFSTGFPSFLGPKPLEVSSLHAKDVSNQLHRDRSDALEELLDPFSTLVAEELSTISNKLRSRVVVESMEAPTLAEVVEYYFKMGVEGKRLRPTVLLLMASSLPVSVPETVADAALHKSLKEKQQCIAEITEILHVASLCHGDALNGSYPRRDKVLAGDFLLSKACLALASLKNIEVTSMFVTVVEHLATGENMQISGTSDQRCSIEYYLQKTYYKTASLIANSCKAIALLGGQTEEVSKLAYEYGHNLGLAYQIIDDALDFTGTSASLGKGLLKDIRQGVITAPILYAIEEYSELRRVVDQGFEDDSNVHLALDYIKNSRGIEKSRELAAEHAQRATLAIDSLPESDDKDVKIYRSALVDLTHRIIERAK